MTSNMIYIVALGVGFKCPRKIHLNTQWEGGIKYTQKKIRRLLWTAPFSNHGAIHIEHFCILMFLNFNL